MDVRERVANKRLIDSKFAQHIANVELSPDDAGTVQWVISHTPTVDAVEVVRCRDCFYYTPVDDNTGKCVFLIGENQYVVPDGYCYLGERKEGVDND